MDFGEDVVDRCLREGPQCDGRLDLHHVIYQQTLRKHGHAGLTGDFRNMVVLCRFHHEQHHSRFRPIPAALLPEEAWEFADELGLTWWVERFYPGLVAA